jgi:ABC-type lipoprotein release transport system permease subunit
VLDVILFLGLVALAWSFARGPRQTVLGNLWTQRLTTALTLSGVALVVFVFVAALMLANGLKETLVATGVNENAIIIRRSSQAEMQSFRARAGEHHQNSTGSGDDDRRFTAGNQ